jgi:hypothetical protein
MEAKVAYIKGLEKIGMTFKQYFDFAGHSGLMLCFRN